MGVIVQGSPAVSEPRQEIASRLRVISLDALRGLVMTLMLAEVLHLSTLGRAFPDNALCRFIAFHTSHVEWEGGSLHDLIQPGFSFLVGAALPFSIAARQLRGQRFPVMFAHAIWRAFILVFLGVFLRSIGKPITNFTFEDTLSQIGLGYAFLFLLGFVRWRLQVAALVAILAGYWAFFALHPAPPGPFAMHWNKNTNAAWAFDVWFLNLFPREQPFQFNRGGYSTLSFIPTLGTMVIGLLTGQWLMSARSHLAKLKGLLIAGASLIAVAVIWHLSGTGPIVKKIWTPSWTLYSGGLVILLLSGFYAIMEVKGRQKWAFPLMVVGMNSIAAYLMSWTLEGFLIDALHRHFGKAMFDGALGAIFRGSIVLAIFWSILYWMYRRKIFLRI